MTTRTSKQEPRVRRRTPRAELREALVRDVLKAFRVIFSSVRRHFAEVERACGMSGAQLWALAKIVALPGLRVADLASALAIHQTTASNLVDRLARSKLIVRKRSSIDHRVVHLFATAEGRRRIASAPGPVEGLLPDALGRLPADIISRLKGDLATLVATLRMQDAAAAFQPLAQATPVARARKGARRGA